MLTAGSFKCFRFIDIKFTGMEFSWPTGKRNRSSVGVMSFVCRLLFVIFVSGTGFYLH